MAELVDRNNNKTEIVYGKSPAGTLEQAKDACCNINWVRNDINEIKSHFIKLGFHLEEISRCEIYKVFGFDDFYEFCEANFHLSRSTVSRHINLFLRFSMRNGKYETPTMFIADRWKDYSYSQLCEMLPLKDKQIQEIKPEMTIEQIREYKKSLKQKNTCATSQKKCNAKAFSKTCDGCYYQSNSGCPYPDEHDTQKTPEDLSGLKNDSSGLCDVAQTEPEQERYLSELSPIVRDNFEALESLGYEIDISVVRDAEYIKDCVEYIKESSDLFFKYIDAEEFGLAYHKCCDVLFALVDLIR